LTVDAKEVLQELGRARGASELTLCCGLVDRVLTDGSAMLAFDAESRARFLLLGFDTSIMTCRPDLALRLNRLATASLAALAPDSETRIRGELKALCLQAEMARLYSDPTASLPAIHRAAAFALTHRARLPAGDRYPVVWEMCELLANCGLRAAAAQLARRMADFAACETGEDDAVVGLMLANEVAFDLQGTMTCALGLDLPRMGDDGADPRLRHKGLRTSVDELQQLERQALAGDIKGNALGLRDWAQRARRSSSILAWASGGGSADAVLQCAQQHQAITASTGVLVRKPARQQALHWAQLASRQVPAAMEEPRPGGGASASPSLIRTEAEYLAAAGHAAAGRSVAALAAYARYARSASRWAVVGQQAIGSDLQGMGELLLALPRRPPAAPAANDPIHLVVRSLQVRANTGQRASLNDVATAQNITPRRLQQAYKSVGLPSPSQVLRRFDDANA
jgi:hypothetical protein